MQQGGGGAGGALAAAAVQQLSAQGPQLVAPPAGSPEDLNPGWSLSFNNFFDVRCCYIYLFILFYNVGISIYATMKLFGFYILQTVFMKFPVCVRAKNSANLKKGFFP